MDAEHISVAVTIAFILSTFIVATINIAYLPFTLILFCAAMITSAIAFYKRRKGAKP